MERALAEESAAGVATATGAETMAVNLRINGAAQSLKIDPRTTLLDALRERLQMTGTKKGLRPRPVRQLARCSSTVGG